MRETVDKILNNEADILYRKSQDKGLQESDLKYLNALIGVYERFVGAHTEEPEPEAQDTQALLEALKPRKVEAPPMVGSQIEVTENEEKQKTFDVLQEQMAKGIPVE